MYGFEDANELLIDVIADMPNDLCERLVLGIQDGCADSIMSVTEIMALRLTQLESASKHDEQISNVYDIDFEIEMQDQLDRARDLQEVSHAYA